MLWDVCWSDDFLLAIVLGIYSKWRCTSCYYVIGYWMVLYLLVDVMLWLNVSKPNMYVCMCCRFIHIYKVLSLSCRLISCYTSLHVLIMADINIIFNYNYNTQACQILNDMYCAYERSLSRGKFTSVVLFSGHTWCAVRSRASLHTVACLRLMLDRLQAMHNFGG